MGRGSYTVRKHCEWSFPFCLGLIVNAHEVGRFWSARAKENWGYTTFCTVARGAWGLWRFPLLFVGPVFMYISLDIASSTGHGKLCLNSQTHFLRASPCKAKGNDKSRFSSLEYCVVAC